MKRRPLLILAAILALLLLAPPDRPGGAEEKKPVYLVEVEGIINPATSRFITESIDRAVEQGSQCVIIELDTPGGLMDSMRAIVKKILTSPVPIVVYVAVMAPSTHIGAAHPVNLGGDGKENSTMSEKIVNDTVSYIKTIAKTRGRNVDWAEKVVRKSVSITEEEAVKLNVVDFVSPGLPDLLARLDGRVITLEDGQKTLATRGLSPRKIEMGWRYRILDILSNPSIAYILLMLGIYGVFFELSNPGAILPGVVGGIFLILAFFALQMLPINFAGLALILFGIILFIAEIKVVSHGLLSVGGVISLFLGSIMLIDSPADYMRISMSVIIPVVIVSAAFFLFAVTLALRARLAKPTTGREGLRGEIGTAVTALAPEGKVSVHGEYWNAVSSSPIEQGARVRVVEMKDLKLKVEKID